MASTEVLRKLIPRVYFSLALLLVRTLWQIAYDCSFPAATPVPPTFYYGATLTRSY